MIAAPSYAPPAMRDAGPTPLLKLSFYCFCLFNLAYYSRFFEWQFAFLHVPLVTSCIALLGASMEGRLLATVQSKIGACMAILTALYAVNVPLSTWKGESFRIFTENWLKAVVAFLIAGGLIVTFSQCRSALNSIGWGAAIASLLANFTGTAEEGRLVTGRGTLGNPNELAFVLLLGLPFVWLMVTDRQASKLKRLLALAMTGSMCYALLRTGSRAGFIGVCLLIFMQFLRASIIGKVGIALGAVILGTWLFVAFPKAMERYKTMFSGADVIAEAQNQREALDIASAIESTQARRRLLMNSLSVTKEHPFLGVGLGAFGSYMASVEKEVGINPHYQGTHNTYTQVSSEAGVPALLCFLGVIIFSFQGLRKLYKRARRSHAPAAEQIANVCFALIATLTAYSVCVFFDYVAYDATLPVLAGFAVALASAGSDALDAAEKAPEVLAQQPDPWAPEFNARRRYPVRPAV
jgi:O-antigen ligase